VDRLVSLRAACIALVIAASSGCSIARQTLPDVDPSSFGPAAETSLAGTENSAEPPVAAASPASAPAPKPQAGKASFYANRFHGRKTASGRPYRKDAYTAAHRTLPLGTWVKVTNTRNDRSVVVQINDRGPYVGRRIIDLSRAAARKIGMIRSGTAPVRLEIVNVDVKSPKKLDVASSEQ
jgi:rare lipoprotein A